MTQPTSPLLDAATRVRENAYAPYSRFKVGAAIRAVSGTIYSGCNVENVAYPEGTCAEAGAIAAPAAILNAINDALAGAGAEPIRSLPATPLAVWEALRAG